MLNFVKRSSKLAIGSTVVFLGIASLFPAVATAPIAPQIIPATLNGQPVYVLNMTRSGDKVLVRCYPGQQPRVAVQAKPNGTKEGTLTCGQ